MPKSLRLDEKLHALRHSELGRKWRSLDDRVTCILCEKTFTGRQIEASVSRLGRVRFRCPTDGCSGSPKDWIRPGNPLTSSKAWSDLKQLLNVKKIKRKPAGQRPAAATI